MNLKDLTDLELIIELLYEGDSKVIPRARMLEPIDISLISVELKNRYQIKKLDSIKGILNFFMGENSPLSEEEKSTLIGMKDFKDKTDPLFKKIRDRK